MKRDIEQDLLSWKEQKDRLPLLLRGARQTGKSYVVENFAQTHFEKAITLNFELQPELIRCFDSLDPQHILSALALLIDQKIEPGKTLLFLDEIQDCPNAIRALRYFKEKLPALHVIGAGSLLEFTLSDADFRMPVGRVQSIYLKPLSFKEYLTAFGHHALREHLEQATLVTTILEPVHDRLLKLVREYLVLGGMPAVLQTHLTHNDLQRNQLMQTTLLNTYRNDFGKYASQTNHKYLQRVFEKAPGLIAEHFKYSKVDPNLQTRDVKNALEMLRYAGLIYPVYSTAAAGIPLISLINEKKFKLLFLDVGLVMRTSKLAHEILLQDDILLINRGALAEQFVGQELLAYTSCFEEAELYFWCREQKSSQAEVDFVTTVDSNIIPIEVKAGATGRLKSLRIFMEEKKSKIGIRISQNKLSLFDNILSIPLYLIGEIPRLVQEVITA
jgi:predicted AAA+ superfamily ATPase